MADVGLFTCNYNEDLGGDEVFPPCVSGQWTVLGEYYHRFANRYAYHLWCKLAADIELWIDETEIAFGVDVTNQPLPEPTDLEIQCRAYDYSGAPISGSYQSVSIGTSGQGQMEYSFTPSAGITLGRVEVNVTTSNWELVGMMNGRGTMLVDQTYVAPVSADWEFDDFNARKKITVKKEAVTGNPTNIPVKVDYTAIDNELYWTLSNHQAGSALKMTTADGDEIPCEAGLRNIGINDTVRLFFLAPALSSTEDTDFYIYYSSEQNVPRTFEAGDIWLPGREGVWHDGFEIVWNGFKRGVN